MSQISQPTREGAGPGAWIAGVVLLVLAGVIAYALYTGAAMPTNTPNASAVPGTGAPAPAQTTAPKAPTYP